MRARWAVGRGESTHAGGVSSPRTCATRPRPLSTRLGCGTRSRSHPPQASPHGQGSRRYPASVTGPSPSIAVIVPTYRRPALAARLVAEVLAQAPADAEVVVV